MANAKVKLVQGSSTFDGVAGDLAISMACTITNSDGSGSTCKIRIKELSGEGGGSDEQSGSYIEGQVLASGGAATSASFTPDFYGGTTIEVIVDEGLVTEKRSETVFWVPYPTHPDARVVNTPFNAPVTAVNIGGQGDGHARALDGWAHAIRLASLGQFRVDGVGVAATEGPVVSNDTAAALGAQQYSPVLALAGYGWGTTGGTSQDVRFGLQTRPVQGAVPTGELHFLSNIAGGGYSSRGKVDSAGKWTLPSLVAAGLAYPTSDGTTGQALFTDGAGTLYWDNAAGGSGGHTLQNNGTPVADETVLEVDGTLLLFTAASGKTTLTAPGLATSAALSTLDGRVTAIEGDYLVAADLAGYMPTSWTLSVGGDLTGGGTGAANRTVTLPDTLTAKTIASAGGASTAALIADKSGAAADDNLAQQWARGGTPLCDVRYTSGDGVQLRVISGKSLGLGVGISQATFTDDTITLDPTGAGDITLSADTAWWSLGPRLAIVNDYTFDTAGIGVSLSNPTAPTTLIAQDSPIFLLAGRGRIGAPTYEQQWRQRVGAVSASSDSGEARTGYWLLDGSSDGSAWTNYLSVSSVGITATGATTVALANAITSSVTDLLTLKHSTSGTAAQGIGAGILLQTEDAGGSTQSAGHIAAVLDTATAGSEKGYLRFGAADGTGALAYPFYVWGSGHVGIGTATEEPESVLEIKQLDAVTAAVTDVFTLCHTSSGTTASGFGTGMKFTGQDAAGNVEDMAAIRGLFTVTSNGTETSNLIFYTRSAGGALRESLRLMDDQSTVKAAPQTALSLGGNMTDGASAVGVILRTYDGYSLTNGSKLVSIRNSNSEVAYVDGAGGPVWSGRVRQKQGVDVASASTLTLGRDGNFFSISGTTDIDYITTTGWQAGSVIILGFQGSLNVKHNTGSVPASTAALKLAGAANFSATADDTLTLVYNGTAWLEVGRSVN